MCELRDCFYSRWVSNTTQKCLNPPASPPSAPGNKCLISFIGRFGYGVNPAHILATQLFAEDQPAQIMLAKSRGVKKEGGNRAKPSLISSASVCATCFQTGLKPCIFFFSSRIACYVFEACEKVGCEFLPSFFSSPSNHCVF